MSMEPKGDIFVVPFFSQGHLNPAMELCRNIASHNFNATLIIPSHLSSSIPSAFSSFIQVADHIPFALETNPLDQQIMRVWINKAFLSASSQTRPLCVVIDVMMSCSMEFFVHQGIPVVSFSTSGAASAALAYARWKAKIRDLKPGETRDLPGLPKQMEATYADLFRFPVDHTPNCNRPDGTGPPPGTWGGGLPAPDQKPPWMDDIHGSIALLINTCDRMERLFIDYFAQQNKFPVWGVGPLLPENFWNYSAGSVLHDREMRSKNRKANYTEDEVFQWLDSKPIGSVIYISFGSEVGPTIEEYKELAKALEESDQPFIWVIQPGSGKSGIPKSFLGPVQTNSEEEEEGYYPEGLDTKVGTRGMIITGWAPQLLILSHPSTGGFLSHCGWNSTIEAIVRGVPILGWPIRGDQFDNAKLVANHLKIGFVITSGVGEDGKPGKINKDEIAAGVGRLMSDEEVHKEAKKLSKEFESGFPVSSVNGLGAFVEFISQKTN